MTKQQRQQAIFEIIEQNECCRQEDLQRELQKRGIETTQATVSRDIRQMGLIKIQREPGVYVYAKRSDSTAKGEKNANVDIFTHAAMRIDYALNTVVIKCRTGMANAACTALDSMELHNVVGTLAGDDTIFVLMRTEADAKALCKELARHIRAV